VRGLDKTSNESTADRLRRVKPEHLDALEIILLYGKNPHARGVSDGTRATTYPARARGDVKPTIRVTLGKTWTTQLLAR